MKKLISVVVILALVISLAMNAFSYNLHFGIRPFYEYFDNCDTTLSRSGSILTSTVKTYFNAYTYRIYADCTLQRKNIFGIWMNYGDSWQLASFEGDIDDTRYFSVEDENRYRVKVDISAYYKLEKETATFYSNEV